MNIKNPKIWRANKFGPECTRWLHEFGWTFKESSKAHAVFEHPRYVQIRLPSSPRVDPRKGLLAEIAKKTGISKVEVEVRLGLRSTAKASHGRRRSRNEEGRRARTFFKPRQEKPLPVPARSLDELRTELGELRARMNTAQGASYKALLEAYSTLNAEYTQRYFGEVA